MNCLSEMISVYSVNKTCMEETFYVLMNIAFDVRVCELLSSACKPVFFVVVFLSSGGKLLFRCLLNSKGHNAICHLFHSLYL